MTRKTAPVPSAPNAEATSPEHQKLPIPTAFAYGIQHVLTMYGGIIAPPLIVGSAAGLKGPDLALLITSCLFIGGLATLLQTLGIKWFGSQLPLVQGTSFASVATLLAIINGGGGLPAIFGAVMAASLIGLIVAPFFAKVIHFFPPVVTGVVITTIGLSLVPVAANWSLGGNAKAPNYGDPANIGLTALTLVIIMLLSKLGSGMISRLSILLSIVIGTVIAAVVGKADFSQVFNGPIFAFPQPFHFGLPTFEPAGIISMVIVVLVILTETTADILAVGEVTGAKVDSKRIANGLRADMLSSAVSPVFNGFTQSAFAQNVGLVAVTGIKSRFAVAAGGVVLVLLGLLPVLGRVVAAVPMPVLGGAGIVLFGTVAASGIRTLAKVDYKDSMNLIIVATSIAFGLVPVVSPTFYSKFPTWVQVIFDSGISSAAIMAVLLNILFNVIKSGNPKSSPSVFAAAPTRLIPLVVLDALEDGDRIENGKIYDRDGNEVDIEASGGSHDH
ncbi:nucleobase:cation symporter-2 family protein [Sinomonas sp. ASV322]|uniref:nucleobase:cation symporter-2 family protein n=1 Tax=Sinomonas sp. ASV322 TaxID=3041920 RepID=UPI0027DCEE50|nr:nucleobase:cation symporter-2 family protein [Sinomonas sp. ASV322]MDQ4502451.1 nucleobase:cation symporter-2 family protein [Sinomonas sp. ASV322]